MLILRGILTPRNLHSRRIFICTRGHSLRSVRGSRAPTVANSYAGWYTVSTGPRPSSLGNRAHRFFIKLQLRGPSPALHTRFTRVESRILPDPPYHETSRSCGRAASDYATRNPTAHFRVGRSAGSGGRARASYAHIFEARSSLNGARKSSESSARSLTVFAIDINYFFIGARDSRVISPEDCPFEMTVRNIIPLTQFTRVA